MEGIDYITKRNTVRFNSLHQPWIPNSTTVIVKLLFFLKELLRSHKYLQPKGYSNSLHFKNTRSYLITF